MPAPEVFAEGLARAGVGDDDAVVAYDDADGVVAARLVWMLRVVGADAALLDGGVRPGEQGLETTPVVRPRAERTVRPWPVEALASLEDALAPGQVVLDARSGERFRGAPDPLDPRPGHLPGARSLPCFGSLDATGRLLPDEVLRRRFLDVGVGDGPVIAYCGSGVTACHDLLVLEHLGLGRGRLWARLVVAVRQRPGPPGRARGLTRHDGQVPVPPELSASRPACAARGRHEPGRTSAGRCARDPPVEPAVLAAFGDAVDACRDVQEALASTRPSAATSARVAALLHEAAGLLADCRVPEDDALVGRVPGPSRAAVHPVVPPLRVDTRTSERLTGRVVLPRTWTGTGGAHGGTLPFLFDEAFGALANSGGRPYGRTAALHVDYRSVTPLERELRLEALFDREEGRKRFLTATLHAGEVLVAEANALFVVLKPGQA
jgi:acyl-coenzyme A thioesterase PaaI-like protein